MTTIPRAFRTIIILCCAIEAVIVLAGLTVFPAAREWVYALGAFWSRIQETGGIYPGQRFLMFITYGFLHGGVIHLAMNMTSLAAIARETVNIMHVRDMLVIYGVSQIAGASLFGIMAADQAAPMVGASGAIFGLAAGLIGAVFVRRRRLHQPQGPLIRAVAMFVALNLGLTILMPAIAWQAHLGGALAGLILGVLLPGRD